MRRLRTAFSILERIDVGETERGADFEHRPHFLSVSSNGSTWVKPLVRHPAHHGSRLFQYPRTRVGTVKRLITPKRNQSVMSQTLHLPQA